MLVATKELSPVELGRRVRIDDDPDVGPLVLSRNPAIESCLVLRAAETGPDRRTLFLGAGPTGDDSPSEATCVDQKR